MKQTYTTGVTTAPKPPKLDSHFNQRRKQITYRITKDGTSSYLLFNREELTVLQGLIDTALGGTSDHTS